MEVNQIWWKPPGFLYLDPRATQKYAEFAPILEVEDDNAVRTMLPELGTARSEDDRADDAV